MPGSRDTYARLALAQVPRLLGNLDRNPYSPAYGSFHRDYWLDKTSDFSDAVRQFAVHALALVYRSDFPGNAYKNHPKIRDWAVAALDFWAGIQHRDGSFDEFYPFERGWVGPTGFTTFACAESFRLLQDEMPARTADRVIEALGRAARFIALGESEEDHLANHHAMACLAVWRVYELSGDQELKAGYERLWRRFLDYFESTEGWCREYDGADPGYLSAVVSFLGKLYASNPDPQILEVIAKAVEFCSYFVYPDGYYAGSLGSRNTLHFYPHGFELVGREIPLASAVAEKMLEALGEDKLVPPHIMSDRYMVYRVPEFLQAYQDYAPRPASLPPLPYEGPPARYYFEKAGITAETTERLYVIANLAKGGTVKVFDRHDGRLLLNDSGIIGRLEDGRVVTSQWIDPQSTREVEGGSWTVEGFMHTIPANKLLTPLKGLLFRIVLMAVGWHPRLAHALKGQIRRSLIMGRHPTSARFSRRFRINGSVVQIVDEVTTDSNSHFKAMSVGDEFYVRYVPQSRYFQGQELKSEGRDLSDDELDLLNAEHRIVLEREVGA